MTNAYYYITTHTVIYFSMAAQVSQTGMSNDNKQNIWHQKLEKFSKKFITQKSDPLSDTIYTDVE